MHTNWILSVMALVAALGLAGCPTQSTPPFDTTGDYAGTWSGITYDVPDETEGEVEGETEGEAPVVKQTIEGCPLELALVHDVDAITPGNYFVRGTATIDYTCIALPDRFVAPPPSTVTVSGLLQQDGTLTLASGGCGTGYCVVLTLDGAGADSDSDGFMDQYDGDWTWLLLLAGVAPFGSTGTYTLDLVTE
jgi:hypothetical protein